MLISPTPWRIFIRSSLICILLGVVVFGLSLRKIDSLPLSNAPLRFDGQRAFDDMKGLAKGFPDRVPWGPSNKAAATWLKQKLAGMGYEPQGMYFAEVIDGKQYADLENVYAVRPGRTHPEQIIVVAGHFDVTDTTSEGAMDDASGTAVARELARLFAPTGGTQPERTIVFLLTNSEEFGAFWGARAFARNFEGKDRIVAMLNFDFVAPDKQTKILTLCDGLKSGFTPLWLREIALDSVRSLDTVKAVDMTNVAEFMMRGLLIPAADHGPFLAAGIPAFNYVGETDNFAYEMGHYHHTKYDVADAMQPQSFVDYGRAAERALRSIDALPRIPDDFRDSSYWKVTRNYYLDGWAALLLHVLAFIPFLAYSLSKFGSTLRRHSRERFRKVLRNESKNMAILLGSFLLGYVLLLLLPALHVITQYETFPATQKSLILYNPNFLAILLVLASILGVYFLFSRVFAEPEDSIAYADIRHAVHAAFLAGIILLAFLKNSYLAVLLLLPPAYFWTAVRARRGREARALNAMLLLGGSITFVAVLIVMSTIFHLGVVYWYMFLAAAYGLISAYSVVVFFMALTVMIRLFRSFVLR